MSISNRILSVIFNTKTNTIYPIRFHPQWPGSGDTGIGVRLFGCTDTRSRKKLFGWQTIRHGDHMEAPATPSARAAGAWLWRNDFRFRFPGALASGGWLHESGLAQGEMQASKRMFLASRQPSHVRPTKRALRSLLFKPWSKFVSEFWLYSFGLASTRMSDPRR
jgi:hypothetical protein